MASLKNQFNLVDRSPQFLRDLEKIAKQVMIDLGKQAEADAKSKVTVVTGNLKESIASEVTTDGKTKSKMIVGARKKKPFKGFHGHLVEFGHKSRDGKMVPPHPFLAPATKNLKKDFNAELIANIKNLESKYPKKP